MHNWNIEKLYTHGVFGTGHIPPQRHLVREFKSRADVKRAISDANPLFKAGTDKRGAIRMSPTRKVEDREALKKEFLDTLKEIDLVVIQDINPGDPGSPSSKFHSYRTTDSTGQEYVITLAGGSFGNKGMDYERNIMAELSGYFQDPDNVQKPEFLEKLEDSLDTEFVDIDKNKSFTRQVKRPLNDRGPADRGEEISDVTLIDKDDNKYYISLKDVGGKTVGNSGASGMFSTSDRRVEFVGKDKGNTGKKLMEAANVDIELVVDGLSDYLNKTLSPEALTGIHITTDEADTDKILDFMGSAFDYGYIYVKRKNSRNDLEIEDLSDKDKLYDFIGEIEKVSVKYPYYKDDRRSRKHVSIMIQTSNGNYSFDIRNASGGVVPNQINLVRGPSDKEIKSAKANVKHLTKSEKDMESMLSRHD